MNQLDLGADWAEMQEYFDVWEDHSEELWIYRQQRNAKMHARINERVELFEVANGHQGLKTLFIKGQHEVHDDLPF